MDTILLVEDEEDDAFFLERAFEAEGIHNPIHIARNGREAMDYLAGVGAYADRMQFPVPRIVLLDLKLPRVMGLAVLKWLRSQIELKTIIVIVLTSSRAASDIEMAYQLGANAYLVKPSGSAELQEIAAGIKAFWLKINTAPVLCVRLAAKFDSDAKSDLQKPVHLVNRFNQGANKL